MSKVLLATTVVVIAIAAGTVWFWSQGAQPANQEVLVLCGGSMRGAMEELISRYNSTTTDTVLASYGGSGELCAQILHTGKGDLYVCHDPFMPWAEDKGVIAEWSEVAALDLVMIVAKDNPKAIAQLSDLAQPGLRLGIGDQTYSTSGQIIKHRIKQLPFRDALLSNVRSETKGHQQRCNDVVLGMLDASIVWNAVAELYRDRLAIIALPEWSKQDDTDAITSATYKTSNPAHTGVTIGIIKGAEQRAAVRRFYEFVTSEGKQIFAAQGFSPAATADR